MGGDLLVEDENPITPELFAPEPDEPSPSLLHPSRKRRLSSTIICPSSVLPTTPVLTEGHATRSLASSSARAPGERSVVEPSHPIPPFHLPLTGQSEGLRGDGDDMHEDDGLDDLMLNTTQSQVYSQCTELP